MKRLLFLATIAIAFTTGCTKSDDSAATPALNSTAPTAISTQIFCKSGTFTIMYYQNNKEIKENIKQTILSEQITCDLSDLRIICGNVSDSVHISITRGNKSIVKSALISSNSVDIALDPLK